MKIEISLISRTSQAENIEIINRVLTAVNGLETLEEAIKPIQDKVNSAMNWNSGRAGSHIWVSNLKGERLILITEDGAKRQAEDAFISSQAKEARSHGVECHCLHCI